MKGFSNESNARILATLEKMFARLPRVNGADLVQGKMDGRMLISRDYTGSTMKAGVPNNTILRRIAYDRQESVVRTTEIPWTSADGGRNATSKKNNDPASIIGYKFRLVPLAEEAALLKMIEEEREKSNPTPTPEPVRQQAIEPPATMTSGAATFTYSDNMMPSVASTQQIVKALEGVRVESVQNSSMIAEILSRIEAHLEQQVEYSKEMLELLRKF